MAFQRGRQKGRQRGPQRPGTGISSAAATTQERRQAGRLSAGATFGGRDKMGMGTAEEDGWVLLEESGDVFSPRYICLLYM